MIVGRVIRAHGIRGEVLVALDTDNPERFAPGSVVLAPNGSPLVIRASRAHDPGLLVSFEGVDDRNGAESLHGAVLSIDDADRRALEEGEFWPDQLQGLEVEDLEGGHLGTIVDVILGSQDRLVVDTAAGIVEVPFVRELVPDVDVNAGIVRVKPIPGLFI